MKASPRKKRLFHRPWEGICHPLDARGRIGIQVACRLHCLRADIGPGKDEAASKTRAAAHCRGFRVELFPEDIKRFMDENIDTIEQLEILRLLGPRSTEEWSATTLSREVQIKPQAITAHLAALQARGLLVSIPRDQETLWKYSPRTPELEAGVRRLLQCYQERPVTMIRMVYARTDEVLKTFANAFRIRKED